MEEIVLEFFPVSRRLVQIAFGDMRNPDAFVSVWLHQFPNEIRDKLPEDGAARREHRKTGADEWGKREQIELGAKLAVIAFLGLLHHLFMRGELVFRRKTQTVNALHLRIRILAAPIRASDLGELPDADLLCFRDMRASAQVGKFARAVDRNTPDVLRIDVLRFFGAHLGRTLGFQIIQQFDFVRLTEFGEQLDRLVD